MENEIRIIVSCETKQALISAILIGYENGYTLPLPNSQAYQVTMFGSNRGLQKNLTATRQYLMLNGCKIKSVYFNGEDTKNDSTYKAYSKTHDINYGVSKKNKAEKSKGLSTHGSTPKHTYKALRRNLRMANDIATDTLYASDKGYIMGTPLQVRGRFVSDYTLSCYEQYTLPQGAKVPR